MNIPIDTGSLRQRRISRLQGRARRYFPLYLMALPGLVYLIINNYIPMAGVTLAFRDYNVIDGIWRSPFVGLDNFKFLFATQDAWIITRNTLLYNLAFIIVGTVVAIFTSVLLNEIRNRFASRFYQTVILLPYLISIVVVSYITYALLNMSNGTLNTLLKVFGLEPILWYNEPKYWPWILIIVNCWKGFGYNTILYYAVIVGIDTSLYEAAMVDGATKLQQIRHITLPSLKSTVVTLTILSIGRIFYSDFGLFYQVPMNSGMLYSATNVIDTYVYRALFSLGDICMSSAASFYQSCVGFLLVMGANALVRRIDSDNALY